MDAERLLAALADGRAHSGEQLAAEFGVTRAAVWKQMAKLAEPGAGCVYELGVVDFERRAWLEDVLANPAGPDLDLYLGRRFDAER